MSQVPATAPSELDRRVSRALAGAIAAELGRLKARGGANVHGVPTVTYATTSHSDGSFHPNDIGDEPAAVGAAGGRGAA